MRNADEKIMRDDFRRDGFHAVEVRMEKDPVNGEVNGIFKLFLRIPENRESSFEDYLNYKNYQLISKKWLIVSN